MKKLILVLFFFITATAFSSERQLAFIVDKDGYTNIRAGQGTDKEIVGIIETGDLFYCEVSARTSWYKVLALKWDKNGDLITGYIHNSRIRIVGQQPLTYQKKLVENTLAGYLSLRKKHLTSATWYDWDKKQWRSKEDSIVHYQNLENVRIYGDTKYEPILLETLPHYFCNTKDKGTLTLFIDVLWVDIGSANEVPAFAIGNCFVCAPGLITSVLNSYENMGLKELIVNHIDWGMLNRFSSETDPEYLRLKSKLQEINY